MFLEGYRTHEADAIDRLGPAINVALYRHTGLVSAGDSTPGQVTPGKRGASAVSNTPIDWMLQRVRGRAAVPLPKHPGIVKTYRMSGAGFQRDRWAGGRPGLTGWSAGCRISSAMPPAPRGAISTLVPAGRRNGARYQYGWSNRGL